jgi:hypothetical protein
MFFLLFLKFAIVDGAAHGRRPSFIEHPSIPAMDPWMVCQRARPQVVLHDLFDDSP